MAWTYTDDPTTVPSDLVRLLIGDTDSNDQLMTDGAIDYALNRYSNDAYRAAALCARQLAAKFAREVDSSLESVRLSASQKHAQYMKLAVEIEKQGGISSEIGGFVDGVSVASVETNREDTDRLSPSFLQGQFNNPGISEGV